MLDFSITGMANLQSSTSFQFLKRNKVKLQGNDKLQVSIQNCQQQPILHLSKVRLHIASFY